MKPPPTPPGSPAPPNTAPTISGNPPAYVLAGQAYSFTPTAIDPDGDTLSFSIANAPAWGTFDTVTGRLVGTPPAGSLGVVSNIVITASDGEATAALPPFSINVVATATGSATLSWTPPTQNTDGSALTSLAGYRIYWGTDQGFYSNTVTLDNPGLTTYLVEQLTPATWYFVVTAFNAQGVESSFSNVAAKTVR